MKKHTNKHKKLLKQNKTTTKMINKKIIDKINIKCGTLKMLETRKAPISNTHNTQSLFNQVKFT